MTEVNESMLERISKLIVYAERSKNEQEAANYWAKAQELMHKYAIDEAMIDAKRGQGGRGRPEGRRINDIGIKDFRKSKTYLLNVVARHNGCRLIDCHDHYIVVGFEMDARFVELLYTSLLLEGWQWLLADRRNDPEGRARPNVYTGNWLEAYTGRISQRLFEANKKVEDEYKPVAGDPNTVTIVLADRRLAVDKRVEDLFPNLRKGRQGGSRHYIGSAREAGRRAGDRADISGGRNQVGERKKLPS